MVSNAAKNAREELHGGVSRYQLLITLVKGTTRKQAESLREKVGVAVKASENVKMFEHCEGGHSGRTLINKLEEKMDKRRKVMEEIVLETGSTATNPRWVINRGRYEAYADAIATLRSSSIKLEIARSDERLGID